MNQQTQQQQYLLLVTVLKAAITVSGLGTKQRTKIKSSEGGKMMTADPTESQNHRMSKVGRDPWRTPSSTPLLKQGPLRKVTQDCAQIVFVHPQ